MAATYLPLRLNGSSTEIDWQHDSVGAHILTSK